MCFEALRSSNVSICLVITSHLPYGLNMRSGLVALSSCAAVTLILFAGGGSEVVLLDAAALVRGGVIIGGGDGSDGIGAGAGGGLIITFFIKRGSGELLSTMLLRKDSGTC